MFSDCATDPWVGTPFWVTTSSPGTAPLPTHGDPQVYIATYVDSTHIDLHDWAGNLVPYAGASATGKGWAVASSSNGCFLGFGNQLYAAGLLADGFLQAYKALSAANPTDPNAALYLAHGTAQSNWIRDKGVQGRSVYSFSGVSMCAPPTTVATYGCWGGDISGQRTFNAEAMLGPITLYGITHDPSMKTMVDTLFTGMWSKPGTGGPNPDGIYIEGMDDGTGYMAGTPPTGQAPKYFGQFFGVTDPIGKGCR